MIDIDLIMESVEWNSLRGFGWQNSSVTYDEMYQIITRLRQAEKDAARYRWLKEQGRHDYDVDDFFDGSCDRIDSKVDEAMQCSK